MPSTDSWSREAFFDELQKIAADPKAKRKSTVGERLAAPAVALAIERPVGHLYNIPMGALHKSMEEGAKTLPKDVDIEALKKTMGVEAPVRHNVGRERGASYRPRMSVEAGETLLSHKGEMPKMNEQGKQLMEELRKMSPAERAAAREHGLVTLGPGAHGATVAHELGHARTARSPWGKVLSTSRFVTKPGGYVGGLYFLAQDDPERAKYAPLAALAGHAPELAEEGLASVRGVGALKRTGQLAPGMLRDLAKAWGTYGVHALAAATPFALAGGLRTYLGRRKAEAKNAGE